MAACASSGQHPSANPAEDKINGVETPEDGVDVTESFPYEANIDQPVTLHGLAQNAKLGAVVVTSDYTPVYMDGMAEWEDSLVGQSIEVSGTLRRKSLAPKAVVNAEGEVSHGIDGDSYVLENPTWTVDGNEN